MTIEKRLWELERHIKTRRGANRRAAFVALYTADSDRAIAVTEALAAAAGGKNKIELGGVLASTGISRLVNDVVRGRYGDVPVHEVTTATALADAVAAFVDAMGGTPPLPPAEVARRARALGLVPFSLSARKAPMCGRALEALIDDERLPLVLRSEAVTSVADIHPWAVWARKDTDAVPVDVAIAAGLAARYISAEQVDITAFVEALAALPKTARSARLRAAQLPASASRLPAYLKLPLLTLVLDDDLAEQERRDAAGRDLAALGTAQAHDVILARPRAALGATLAVCERIDVEEAHAIYAPLVRAHQIARDLLCASRLSTSALWLDDAVAVLADDPVGGVAMLARCHAPRARAELLRLFEAAPMDDAKVLLFGLTAPAVTMATRAWLLHATLDDVLVGIERGPDVVMEALRALLPRAGRYAMAMLAAIDRVDR